MTDSLLIWFEDMRLDDIKKHGLKNLLVKRNPIKLRGRPRRSTNGLVFIYAFPSKNKIFKIVGIFVDRDGSASSGELKFTEDELVELDEYLILYYADDKTTVDNLDKYNSGKSLGPNQFQYIDEKCTRNIINAIYSQQMKENIRKKLDSILKLSGLRLAQQ